MEEELEKLKKVLAINNYKLNFININSLVIEKLIY